MAGAPCLFVLCYFCWFFYRDKRQKSNFGETLGRRGRRLSINAFAIFFEIFLVIIRVIRVSSYLIIPKTSQ